MKNLREAFTMCYKGSPEEFFKWCNANLDKNFSEMDFKKVRNLGLVLMDVGADAASYVSQNCKHTNTKKEYEHKEVCLDCGMYRLYMESDEEGWMGSKIWKWTDWA